MKFLSVRDLRNRPGRVWKTIRGKEMVLTANGKPVAILVGVAEDELEETLSALRRAKAQTAVSRLRAQAAKKGSGSLTQEEIEAEISAARSERSAS
jgi:prevent-host-death family protein